MTCKREDLAKGLEPDDCYYVQNEAKVRNKVEIDFAVDPPPDLAIEVEVSQQFGQEDPDLCRPGVPELWRYDGQILRIFELVDGQYQSREGSCLLSGLPGRQGGRSNSADRRGRRYRVQTRGSAAGCGRRLRTEEREKNGILGIA